MNANGQQKIYIMAAHCTGKSYFAANNSMYRGVHVVDFDKVVSRFASRAHKGIPFIAGETVYEKGRSIVLVILQNLKVLARNLLFGEIRHLSTGRRYQAEVLAYLRSKRGAACVLGHLGAFPKPTDFHDITFAAVVLPTEQHKAHCEKRRRTNPSALHGSFEVVSVTRENLLRFAREHRIPTYQSFDAALNDIIARAGLISVSSLPRRATSSA